MLSITPLRLLAGLALAATLAAGSRDAQEPEDELKAAVVLSFLRYGDWHGTLPANGALTVGVVGRPVFANVLRHSLEGKTVDEHPVHVVEIKNAADQHGCAIVYFTDDKGLEAKSALQGATPARVLTIGEARDFLDSGGAVRLFVLDGHITFEVSLEALDRSGVSISSRLLRFGQIRNPKKGDRS